MLRIARDTFHSSTKLLSAPLHSAPPFTQHYNFTEKKYTVSYAIMFSTQTVSKILSNSLPNARQTLSINQYH